MPTYQYACTACDERLEAVQRFTDAPLTECPLCSGALRKVFSAVGVVFKGSGFYKNDSRDSGKKAAPKEAAAATSSSGSSSDASSSSAGASSTSSSGSSSGSTSGSSSGSGSGSGSGSDSKAPAKKNASPAPVGKTA